MPAIILMAVWKNFGYNMLIFIAGLQAFPRSCTRRPQHRRRGRRARGSAHVTLPMLGPTLLFVGVITMIGYFQLFAEPYVMTQGGPLQQHDQRRAADVRGRLPLVADGLRGGDRLRALRGDPGRDAAPGPAAGAERRR